MRQDQAKIFGGDEKTRERFPKCPAALGGDTAELIKFVKDRPGHDRRYSLDTTKLRGLGWSPQRPFEDGLSETVAWYHDNRSWWEPIKSGAYRKYYDEQYAERLG